MDCLKSVREYLLSIIEQSGKGQIKTLLLDSETTRIVSLAFSQSGKNILSFLFQNWCDRVSFDFRSLEYICW